MERITQREMILQDELNLLAYEQRELNNYKQKEGANPKAIEIKERIIEQRLSRYNKLNSIYDEMENDLKYLVSQRNSKSNISEKDFNEMADYVVMELEFTIAQYELELIEYNKQYQSAPDYSIKEWCSGVLVMVTEMALRSFKTALNFKTNIYLKPQYHQ